MKKFLMFMLAAACAAHLRAADETVQAAGVGATYGAAVNEALVFALEQHDGVAISSSARSSIVNSDSSTSVSASGALDETTKLELNDAISREMKKWAQGKISSYRVLSDSYDEHTRRYRVVVEAVFPGPYVVGRDPANLRRMAVSPFRVKSNTYSWHGQSAGTAEWSMTLADCLNELLTQTRKFSMVDRKFDAEVNDELARLADANASKADSVRLSQKLGTDYLVVGEVALSDVTAPAVNPITGQALAPISAPFAEVRYRVLLAPTGQLKWSDVVRIDSAQFSAGTLAEFVSQTAEAAAQAIVDGMMANILPFEIVSITPAGTIVIGEGGRSLEKGEVLVVYALGEEVADTRTGEIIDQIEESVGAVEVTAVSPKLSYARVIDGDIARMAVGSRLRRPETVPAPPPPPATTPTPMQVLPSGGVVLPF